MAFSHNHGNYLGNIPGRDKNELQKHLENMRLLHTTGNSLHVLLHPRMQSVDIHIALREPKLAEDTW